MLAAVSPLVLGGGTVGWLAWHDRLGTGAGDVVAPGLRGVDAVTDHTLDRAQPLWRIEKGGRGREFVGLAWGE